MEFVRNKRDSNVFQGLDWLDGFSSCISADGCIVDSYQDLITPCAGVCPLLKRDAASGVFNYVSGEDSLFTRKVNISSVSSDEIEVKVELSWPEIFSSPVFTLQVQLLRWH